MSQNLNTLDVFVDKSGTNGAECSRKGMSGRRVAGAIFGLWLILGVCSLGLRSCMSHCWSLFLHMVERQ